MSMAQMQRHKPSASLNAAGIRLNYGHPWGAPMEAAMATLESRLKIYKK